LIFILLFKPTGIMGIDFERTRFWRIIFLD
jgi:hypothetical protein